MTRVGVFVQTQQIWTPSLFVDPGGCKGPRTEEVRLGHPRPRRNSRPCHTSKHEDHRTHHITSGSSNGGPRCRALADENDSGHSRECHERIERALKLTGSIRSSHDPLGSEEVETKAAVWCGTRHRWRRGDGRYWRATNSFDTRARTGWFSTR